MACEIGIKVMKSLTIFVIITSLELMKIFLVRWQHTARNYFKWRMPLKHLCIPSNLGGIGGVQSFPLVHAHI